MDPRPVNGYMEQSSTASDGLANFPQRNSVYYFGNEFLYYELFLEVKDKA